VSHTQLKDEASLFQTSLQQRFDEKYRKYFYLENTMETIFQDLVNDFHNKIDLVDDLVKEVKSISQENVSLKTKNAGLKNKLKTTEEIFQTAVNDHSRRIVSMGNTATSFSRILQMNLRKIHTS
jgi:regulator of replication initiation timing